MSEINQEKLKE